MNLDFSIQLIIISVAQLAGVCLQYLIDFKFSNTGINKRRLFAGAFLSIYNIGLIIAHDYLLISSSEFLIVASIILSTILFEKKLGQKKQIINLFMLNAMLYGSVWFVLSFGTQLSSKQRDLVIAMILVVYLILHGIVQAFFNSSIEKKTDTRSLLTGLVIVPILFGAIIIVEPELQGIITVNLIFIALVVLDFLDQKLEGLKEQELSSQESTFNPNQTDGYTIKSFPEHKLTVSQRKVAILLLEKKSVIEIADILEISENAVHRHCSDLNKRLDCSSTLEFVQKYGNSK